MSYRKLLTDRCDVYHLKAEGTTGKYGVPGEDKQYYSDTPDLTDVPCYFTERGQAQAISQGEPNTVVTQSFLVHFLPTEDIRLKDKVVFSGAVFELQTPRKVKNHHWEVMAVRNESL